MCDSSDQQVANLGDDSQSDKKSPRSRNQVRGDQTLGNIGEERKYDEEEDEVEAP